MLNTLMLFILRYKLCACAMEATRGTGTHRMGDYIASNKAGDTKYYLQLGYTMNRNDLLCEGVWRYGVDRGGRVILSLEDWGSNDPVTKETWVGNRIQIQFMFSFNNLAPMLFSFLET